RRASRCSPRRRGANAMPPRPTRTTRAWNAASRTSRRASASSPRCSARTACRSPSPTAAPGTPPTCRSGAGAATASLDDRDDPAGQTRAGVAGGLAGVIVRSGVDDDRAPGDVGRAAATQGQAGHVYVHARDALGVGDDVVHVAGVVRAVVHASVRGARRVEVPARAG